MTKIIILVVLIVLIYWYWKSQQAPNSLNKSPEVLYETEFPDLELKEISPEQSDWFGEKRWLSDREIDWALEQVMTELPEPSKYKVLESTQFMFTKEAMDTKDPEARFSFPVLLSDLTSFKGNLVFIPVNNPDFHWSLLVYEVKEKKFYHFDTLRGANDSYVKPLLDELLKFLLENWQDSKFHVETRYHLKQGNTWDCGMAVIEIAKAIMKDYPTYQRYRRKEFTSSRFMKILKTNISRSVLLNAQIT